MDNDKIGRMLASENQEDMLIAIEILKTKRPRLTKNIIGALYAHVSERYFEDFLEYSFTTRKRLLPDYTNTPDTTAWSLKYREE